MKGGKCEIETLCKNFNENYNLSRFILEKI